MNILGKPATYYLRLLASKIGSRLRDVEGQVICRAFLFTWRGKILIIGAPAEIHLRLVAMPQARLTYWVQQIVWERASPPDFQRSGGRKPQERREQICHVIITHLGSEQNSRMVAEWRRLDPNACILLAHGGKREDFDDLPSDIDAVFVADPALRTRNHSKEKQEYAGVMEEVASWLEDKPAISHVHLAEYDVAPIAPGLGAMLMDHLSHEDADVIGSGVYDWTQTFHPHALYHQSSSIFTGFLKSLSVREDKQRILSMLGCTSTWTRECFMDVAAHRCPERVYLEIALASLPHHRGWRVRPLPLFQQTFLNFQGDLSDRIGEFSEMEAWIAHPCKTIWENDHVPACQAGITGSKSGPNASSPLSTTRPT
ncbi:MAG: hypothetical protein EOP84_00010 [Verrucomicrobiaceae bacterium]|nr:MAG: hypothetical protein EOP84_00010 [Verrucomicrobiaceae bacterium]